MNDVLFLISARSGSKGMPNKNIMKLFGVPLLAIRGLSALRLTSNENIWLSTDSHEYAAIGHQYGLTVPFIRPHNLATDEATSSDVILHAIEYAESKGYNYKYIALLEPTSPFVYSDFLLEAITRLKDNSNASSIVATKIVETSSVFVQRMGLYLDEIARKIEGVSIRRQDFFPEITPSGGFYISRWEDFKNLKTFYTSKTMSYLLPEICSLEIDTELQFRWAEFLISHDLIELKKIYNNENI